MKSIEILVCLWSELFDVTGACCYWWSLQGGKLEGIGPKFPDPLNHFRVFFVVVLSKGVKTKLFHHFFHPKFSLPKNSGISISMHICASEHFVPGGRCGVGNDKEVEFQTGRCLSGAWTSSFQAQVTRVCLKTHLSYFHLSMQSQTSFVNVFEMLGLSWNLPFWRWWICSKCLDIFLPSAVDLVDLAHVRLSMARYFWSCRAITTSDEAMKRQLKWQFAYIANANRRVCMSSSFGQDVKRVKLEISKSIIADLIQELIAGTKVFWTLLFRLAFGGYNSIQFICLDLPTPERCWQKIILLLCKAILSSKRHPSPQNFSFFKCFWSSGQATQDGWPPASKMNHLLYRRTPWMALSCFIMLYTWNVGGIQ